MHLDEILGRGALEVEPRIEGKLENSHGQPVTKIRK